MSINLKLKERREKINKQISRDKSKTFKQYKQDLKAVEGNPDEAIKKRIDSYYEIEEKQKEFERRFSGGKSIVPEESRDKGKKGGEADEGVNRGEKGGYSHSKGRRDREGDNEKKANENKGYFAKPQKQFLGKKRKKEDIDKEIEEKKNKRKKTYRNLSKKTKYGQPIMKYKIQNILSNLKSKISKGII